MFKNLLSHQDALHLLGLIYSSLSCSKEDDLKELINRLSSLIPYDFAICVFGKKEIDGVGAYEILNMNYPVEWIELYNLRKYHEVDPVIKMNFTNFKVQYWADTYKISTPPREFLSLAEDFGLKDGYTHGIKKLKGTEGSLFSISGKSIKYHNRTETILEYIIPHLHQVLVRILNSNKKHTTPLSTREREVLNWLKQGKSSWDVSTILHISERTVNFHINNIMQKLDAVNRPQAVAVAIERRLIDIE